MKKTILFVLSLMTGVVMAQDFEGVIDYKFDVDAGEQTAQLQQMMPNGMTLSFKGEDSRVDMRGGMAAMMGGGIITKGAEQTTYSLMPAMKTAYFVKVDDQPQIPEESVKVAKSSEKQTIAGYNCSRYDVEVITEEGNQTMIIWSTNEIDIKNTNNSGVLTAAKQVEGFPMRVEMYQPMPTGIDAKIVLEVDKIERKTVDAALFEIPEDYKVEPMENLMQGQGGF